MLTQIATIIGEGAVIGQLVLGVVLFPSGWPSR